MTKKRKLRWLSRAVSFFRNVTGRQQDELDIAAEVSAHLDLLIEEKLRSGMKPDEAERAARIELGGVEQVKQQVREARTGAWLDTLAQDCRFALRMARKNPGFTAIVVLTLALGIAANTTVLSWMSATLLNPIPGVAYTSDLVTVDRGDRNGYATPPFSYPDLRDLSEHTQTFSGILGYHNDYMSLTGVAKPERIFGALTTASYFDVLGVRPILGRTFLPEEGTPHAGAAVIVLGYAVWQNHFGGDPQIIGKTIQINRHPYTVIGVAPRDFTGCATGLRTELWIPLPMDRDVWGGPGRPDYRGIVWLNALGKLRPGVTKNQAEAELNLLMQGIVERFPEDHRDRSNEISLDPLWRSRFGLNGYLYKVLPMLMGLAAVLLLLACANVAGLLLVRSVGRRREIAIRLGMGASRKQIIRQFLIESLLLGLLGGTAAIAIAVWTSRSLVAFFPPSNLPLTNDAHIDQRVLFVTIAVSILAAILFGILPALRSASLPVQSVLKEEATSVSLTLHKSRLLSGLVVAQISLSLVLLVCAGLFTRSLQKAQQSDPGFEASHLLLASYDLSPAGYTRATAAAFNRQVLARLSALPGVESVTLADFSPLSFSIHSEYLQIEGYVPQPHEWMEISRAIVGPNYFRTLRTAMISGREFTEADTLDSQPVAVVNQAFVDRYWPGENAIGKQVTDGARFTIVGIARNAKYRMLTSPAEPVFYLTLYQSYSPAHETTIHLRTTGDPRTMAFSVEETIHQLNQDLPLFNVNPLSVTMQLGTLFQRVAVTFAGSFGLLAMLLAAVGIYGVVAYTTRQRSREIGVRMALGAEKGGIYSLVLGQGFRLTLAGLVAGTALAVAFTRLLKAQLFGVSQTDVITFASVGLLLAVVALVACHIPARRATRVDPMVALRYE